MASSDDTTDQTAEGMEPHLLTILSKKFEMVTRDMTQTLLKSARSGVINSARDFSSAVTLHDGRQFMIDEGLPAHLGNVHFTPRYTLSKFDDIAPGDCFLTNSPYAGGTHHADYTLHAPVFHDDEFLFWSINRAHQADVGAPLPSTYLGGAATVYEEGPHFPAIRIQADYEDRDDVVRTLKTNIRASERQWYGDYRAQVAAVRRGEEELRALCDEYGTETIREFSSAWLAYGEEMMRAEIRDLPATTIENTSRHDPIPDAAPEGIPVRVSIEIDPDEERIRVDLTDNPPNIPAGFNLSEATTVSSVYGGIFVNVDPDVPHNHGSIGRIEIEMDEGKVVGRPEYPVGTATATTNVSAVLFNAVQGAFGELGEPYGLAEGNAGVGAFEPVISGVDHRNGEEYINQLILAAGGAPGLYGHDGWMTYTIPVSAGIINADSVEIDEQKYPILIRRHEFETDTAGPGEWRGAPGARTVYEPRENPVSFTYYGDGGTFPPAGIRGGGEGAPDRVWRETADGREDLPTLTLDDAVEVRPGEALATINPGGGGYGDPLDRDPERVRADVEAGYVSVEGAREDYGVVVDASGDGVAIDGDATARLRAERREAAADDEGGGEDDPSDPADARTGGGGGV